MFLSLSGERVFIRFCSSLFGLALIIVMLHCSRAEAQDMASHQGSISTPFRDTQKSKRYTITNFVPEWSKKAVWYQIFPERFRNGDPTNDPTLASLKGAYPHDIISPWQIHPWGSDWYELQPYEKKNKKSIWYNIQRRRYGGDLQGIIDKLDYLHDLGVTALYLNPIFDAPSSHKYDGKLYHHVDVHLGPDPEGDKKLIESEIPDDPSTWVWTKADQLALTLIKEAHQRGMRIIFDGVFNHMGIESFVFLDVKKNGAESRFKDWLIVKQFGDSTGKGFEYTGWFNVRELPELNEINGDYPDALRDYLYACTERWMKPNGDINAGIDGWRLDVAFCIGHPFWKRWRAFVRLINPEAYLTAEVIDTPEAQKPYLQGDEFDAMMNYNFAFAVAEFLISKRNKLTAKQFDKRLAELRAMFPSDVSYGMMNLFGSHDTDRLGSHIVNRDILDYRQFGKYFDASKASNPAYAVRKPNAEEIKIQKLVSLFQMTYVGAPMIYYGDEVGMWGANDPCDRKPMIWDDISFAPEATLPNGEKRKADKVEKNFGLWLWYKSLINIRNTSPSLQTGSFKTLIAGESKPVYAFSRVFEGDATHPPEETIVALNTGDVTEKITLNVDGSWWDMINNIQVELSYQTNVKLGKIKVKDGKKKPIQKRIIKGKTSTGVVIFLPPKSGIILKRV